MKDLRSVYFCRKGFGESDMRPEIARTVAPFVGGLIAVLLAAWAFIEQSGENIYKYQILISASLAFCGAAGGLLVVLLRRAFEEIDNNDAEKKAIERDRYKQYEEEKISAAILSAFVGKISYVIPSYIDFIKDFDFNIEENYYDNPHIRNININVAIKYFEAINTLKLLREGVSILDISTPTNKNHAQENLNNSRELLDMIEDLLISISLRGSQGDLEIKAPISDEEANLLIERSLVRASAKMKRTRKLLKPHSAEASGGDMSSA